MKRYTVLVKHGNKIRKLKFQAHRMRRESNMGTYTVFEKAANFCEEEKWAEVVRVNDWALVSVEVDDRVYY